MRGNGDRSYRPACARSTCGAHGMLVAVVMGLCLTAAGCSKPAEVTDTGLPERCTRVFIRAENGSKSDFDVYVPRFEEQLYRFTEYAFENGGREYVYRIDTTVYYDRQGEDYANRLVTHEAYMRHCKGEFFELDTLYLVRETASGYREYNVQRWDVRSSEGSGLFVTIGRKDASPRLLIDYGMPVGYRSADAGRAWEVIGIDSIQCYTVHHIRKYTEMDTVDQTYVRGLGLILEESGQGELTRQTAGGKPLATALSDLCK